MALVLLDDGGLVRFCCIRTCSPVTAFVYLPTTSTTKVPGFTVRWGLFDGSLAGVCWNSAAGRKILLVFGSNAMVLALGCVCNAPASSYLSADSSWKMFRVPSPQEKKIRRALGSNPAKSTPAPIGKLVITLPVAASMTTIVGFSRQPINRRLVLAS